MAVGVEDLPNFYPVAGFAMGVANAGIKQTARPDVCLFAIAEGASVAGVFTQNAFCAAPVQVAKKHLATAPCRYFVVNTGNANAGTGAKGLQAAVNTTHALAQKTSLRAENILPFSTGVIGELLADEKIIAVMDEALANVSEGNFAKAASAIMTTDTRPKGVSRKLSIAGKTVTISGISKGSGMIKPNMATMLGYLATDAKVPQNVLEALVKKAADVSFNAITVDGDTSTNDACMVVATGQGELDYSTLNKEQQSEFEKAITDALIVLAQLIVKDGEGATKFVHVSVSQGPSVEAARKIAFAVAESPLVKTALFASDANWGRILAAVGRAGVDGLNVDSIALSINGVLIAENGGRAESYTEEAGSKAMAEEEIIIDIQLNQGQHKATVYTCDFSHEYVSINADYRS